MIAARLHTDSIDIMMVQETRTTKNVIDGRMHITGYTYVRRDRGKGAAGGVALYIRNGLNPSKVKFVSSYEIVGAICWLGNTAFLVASAYKPPTTNSDTFFDAVSDFINSNTKYATIIIGMDDNCDLLKASTSNIIKTFCQSNNIKQIVLDNTTTHKNSNIDHLYVRGAKTATATIASNIEKHHSSILGFISIQNGAKIPKPPQKRVQVWRLANWDHMADFLHNDKLLDKVKNCCKAEEAWDVFKTSCLTAIDNFVPKVLIRPQRWSPWFTREIKMEMKTRDKLYRRWKYNRQCDKLKSEFKKADRNVKKLIHEAKRKHWNVAFDKSTRSSKQIWAAIKTITKPSEIMSPNVQKSDGSMCAMDKEKCDVLMQGFASCWKEDEFTYELKTTNKSPPKCPPALLCHFMSKLDPFKSVGEDGIPGRFLKELRYDLCEPLAFIFSLAVSDKIPIQFKRAVVKPFKKSANAIKPNEFRPISVLPVSSKLFERWILSIMHPLVDAHLPTTQYGFRLKMGTVTSLLSIQHKIHLGFEECKKANKPTSVCIISFDIAKAFDRMSQSRVLDKLEHRLKLPPWLLSCIHDYLSDRTTYVSIGEAKSAMHTVTSGTPQGGVLSPILFNVSMIEFADINISDGCSLFLFADDIVLIKKMDKQECVAELQRDVDAVNSCVKRQNQTLNPLKTHGLLCSVARNKVHTSPNILLNGQVIHFGDTLRILGVLFDHRLTMLPHIIEKTLKAKQLLGATINALRSCGQHKMIGRIWSSTILPVTTYGAMITFGRTQAGDNKLMRLQMAAARCATNDYGNDEMLLKRLNWQPITVVAKSQRLRIAYQLSHEQQIIPDGTVLCKQSGTNTNRRSQRKPQHNKQLETTFVSTTATGDMCVTKLICNDWNTLEQDTVNLSLGQFKNYTKQLLC
jgi:hypothetical protein